MVAYLVVAHCVQAYRKPRGTGNNKHFIEQVFDGATFAMSLALFCGVLEPIVLDLIGNLKIFLLICSTAGAVYGIRALLGLS